MRTLFHFSACLLLMSSMTGIAAPITYYDIDFEDDTAGGGIGYGGKFGDASVIASSELDGKSLLFELDDQMVWARNAEDATTHYVAFDYYAESGANVTQFLDVPSILRLDVGQTGRHHVDVYYDLSTKQAWSYLDGTPDASLLTIMAWPAVTPYTNKVRIANQVGSPGSSKGIFEIDNFLWQGNVDEFSPVARTSGSSATVPAPGAFLLTSLGAGLVGYMRRRQSL